jgi:hypothetical protein
MMETGCGSKCVETTGRDTAASFSSSNLIEKVWIKNPPTDHETQEHFLIEMLAPASYRRPLNVHGSYTPSRSAGLLAFGTTWSDGLRGIVGSSSLPILLSLLEEPCGTTEDFVYCPLFILIAAGITLKAATGG